jgi:hypothetical protein
VYAGEFAFAGRDVAIPAATAAVFPMNSLRPIKFACSLISSLLCAGGLSLWLFGLREQASSRNVGRSGYIYGIIGGIVGFSHPI